MKVHYLIFSLCFSTVSADNVAGFVDVKYPSVLSSSVPFSVSLYFSPLMKNYKRWPDTLNYTVYGSITPTGSDKIPLKKGTFCPYVFETSLPGVMTGTFENVSEIEIDELLFPGGNPLGNAYIFVHLDGDDFTYESSSNVYGIPAWITILPSLITVVVAMLLKQNILALFLGVFVGTTFLNRYNPLLGLLRTLDNIVISGIADPEHASVIYFCLLIGGMIAVVGRGGGALGMSELVTGFSKTRRKGLLATCFIGVLTFFDDYASCLIAGATMKDITGRLYVSREKLSFIVDTFAACMSSLAPFSSWIGVELDYIGKQLNAIGSTQDPYSLFLQTLPYRFYPLLIIFFAFATTLLNRDFGPMLSAEQRAVRTAKLVADGSTPLSTAASDEHLSPKEDKPRRWFNAVVPFVVVVLVIIAGMLLEGYHVIYTREAALTSQLRLASQNGLTHLVVFLQQQRSETSFSVSSLFAASSPFHALIWASFLGSVVSIVLVCAQRILTLAEAMDAWLAGTKTMLFAILILVHAWGLGMICSQLHTSAFIAHALGAAVPGGALPAIVFVLAALVAFSTGSAFGTMSILFPLMIPLADALAPGNQVILLATISSILSGAVWGNQTSPIADSCIMSSMACGADHGDHVKTQAVYAVFVGAVSVLLCSLPVGMEAYPWYVGILLSTSFILFILMAFGRRPEDTVEEFPISELLRKYTPLFKWTSWAMERPPLVWFSSAWRSLGVWIKARRRNIKDPCPDSPVPEVTDLEKGRSPGGVYMEDHYLLVTEPFRITSPNK